MPNSTENPRETSNSSESDFGSASFAVQALVSIADRRVTYLRITATGQDMVDVAVNDYLHAAAEAARLVRPAGQRALFAAYLQLLRGLTQRDEARQ